jgi:hypothetical protein
LFMTNRSRSPSPSWSRTGRSGIVVPLIDPELVRAGGRLALPSLAEVDVEPAVRVDVGQCHARGPRALRVLDARPLGHIAEGELPLIAVDPRSFDVRREDELRQAVAGEVADGDASPVVVVAIGEDVELGGGLEPVLEANPRGARRKSREQLAPGLGQVSASGQARRLRWTRAGHDAEREQPAHHRRRGRARKT